MAAQRGRDILLKIKTETSGDYITLAGLRSKSIRFNARTVDITHSDSANAWRELLPGAGVKSVDITGSGIFRDAESDALARSVFFEQSAQDFQFIIPDFGLVEGPFLISALNYSGTYNGEAGYEISLVSSGAPSFTPIA